MGASARLRANFKAFFFPSLLLAGALATALVSSVARRDGQFYASAFLALLSLLLAAVSSVLLIPKLLARIKLDFLNSLRFFRFTKRGLSFILIVLVIAFSALNTGNNLLILVLSFLLAALIVSGVCSNLVLHGLRISLNVPQSIHAGQRAVFFVTLSNLKRVFPSFALRLKGHTAEEGADERATNFFLQETNFPCILAGERLKLDLLCEFKRRGVYQIDGFEVRTSFPFGFFSRGRELKAHGSIVIYPELRPLEALLRTHPHLLGSREKRRKGMGAGLYNIRPYRGGDGTRFIHWKSTAKLSQLMVKDFLAEEESPLNLVFSTFLPEPTPEALASFEAAVSTIASLGRRYKLGGQTFSFYSGEFSVEVNGRHDDYEAFMEYLSCVGPSSKPLLNPRETPPDSMLFAAGKGEPVEAAQRIDYLKLR